jgi:NAD(P)-dependent dehydrogenase (short-subunit alcohol dehydrogenase family)
MTTQQDEHPWMKPGLGRLAGRVALVTAADSGIGRAAARLFAREGARVVCVDRDEIGSPRVDELIARDGGEAVFLRGDVSQKAVCEEMVALALERYGDLHVAFLNAGTGVRERIDQTSEEAWNHVLETNLQSVFHGVRAALSHFLKVGRGNIVATASSLGVVAPPNYPAYAATKAGIIHLTRQLALDYGPDIRVNCVCPGPIETNRVREFPPRSRAMTDAQRQQSAKAVKALHRMGRPEEVAYAALFLASDESSFITGHALVIDGGPTIGV